LTGLVSTPQREENEPSVEFAICLAGYAPIHEYKYNIFNDLALAEREGFGLSLTL
jgi:hypothetical protein